MYKPYLLINKKRYAGLLYTNPEKPDKMDAKVRSSSRKGRSPGSWRCHDTLLLMSFSCKHFCALRPSGRPLRTLTEYTPAPATLRMCSSPGMAVLCGYVHGHHALP